MSLLVLPFYRFADFTIYRLLALSLRLSRQFRPDWYIDTSIDRQIESLVDGYVGSLVGEYAGRLIDGEVGNLVDSEIYRFINWKLDRSTDVYVNSYIERGIDS